MSAPDHVVVAFGQTVIPRYDSHPHATALLPIGMALDDVGASGQQVAAVFLVDRDCAGIALNDAALDLYIRGSVPVLIFATQPRDLRPFLRRAEQFRRRGFAVEVLP